MRKKIIVTKKQRKKLTSRLPSNLAFWKLSLTHPEEVEAFIIKGNKRQHACIIRVLKYVKQFDKEYFEKVNGIDILRRIKNES